MLLSSRYRVELRIVQRRGCKLALAGVRVVALLCDRAFLVCQVDDVEDCKGSRLSGSLLRGMYLTLCGGIGR